MENLDRAVDTERIPYADKIVVATNCLYENYRSSLADRQRSPEDTDGIRGDLALELFKKAISLGARIIVCDGGSSTDFISALHQFTDEGLTIVGSDTPGRGPQRRSAFKAACLIPGIGVILYTQPEKVSLMDHLTEISKPIIEGRADIVIPRRNQQLFEQSYPDYMRESEIRVNHTYDWLMKKAGRMTPDQSFDWFFGPVAFKNDPAIVALFLKEYKIEGKIRSRINAQPNPEMHSDGHYFPIIEALFNKRRVVSIEVPFVYPPTQKANEISPERKPDFMERRKLDGAAYRLEAIHFLRSLQGKPSSIIIDKL